LLRRTGQLHRSIVLQLLLHCNRQTLEDAKACLLNVVVVVVVIVSKSNSIDASGVHLFHGC
jgi:hypothetical protein